MYNVEQFMSGRYTVLNDSEGPETGCENKLLISVGPGESIEVRCRRCAYCIRVRRRECIGRCLSEMQSADAGYFATLTYGRDDKYRLYKPAVLDRTGEVLEEAVAGSGEHRHAHDLFYEDVQIWCKRMRHHVVRRIDGLPASFRYFVCGEYGPEKGRAHWHVIVFTRNCEIPNLRLEERYIHEAQSLDEARAAGKQRRKRLWQDGWTWWEPISLMRVGYVMKYMGKDWQALGCRSVAHGSASLGVEYYERLARRYVENGLSPQNSMYQIPGHDKREAFVTPQGIVTKRRGEYFPMTRATGARFIRAFVAEWRSQHGVEPWPCSEWVERGLERDAEREAQAEWLESLREREADAGEYGTVYDRAALEEALDRRGWQTRLLHGLRPGPKPKGYNHYEAMSRGW